MVQELQRTNITLVPLKIGANSVDYLFHIALTWSLVAHWPADTIWQDRRIRLSCDTFHFINTVTREFSIAWQ